MAWTLKDRNGNCCGCSERVDPCLCGLCAEGSEITTAVLQCRRRGGIATLCGFSEFTSPSAPPKKYRENTIQEDWYWCTYPSAGCSSATTATFVLESSGKAVYDAVSCNLTTITAFNRTAGLVQSACGKPSSNNSFQTSRASFDENFMIATTTRTSRVLVPRPPCFQFGTSAWVSASGGGREDLSVEDTEEDAIARLLAGPGGEWGEWADVGDGLGSTCVAAVCCQAHYYDRGSGFSFAYAEAEWRVKPEGQPLEAGCYDARVDYYRRVAGSSDPWEVFAFESFQITVDAEGVVTASSAGEKTVPNDAGWETYAGNLRLCPKEC